MIRDMLILGLERMEVKERVEMFIMAAIALIYLGRTEAETGHDWQLGHATFYGDMKGNETVGGACGYDNPIEQGYGLETTALSTALFNDGLCCGACYEIMCHNSSWCLKKAGAIRVTATNFCPANYSKPSENWCNPPLKHFDLSQPMFRAIAEYKAGIVPVIYRRVTCVKKGGIKFELKGNPFWILVLVYNVGGVGDVDNVMIKGCNTSWVEMSRSWGQNWVTNKPLVGQSMSFKVTTSDGRMVQSMNVVPAHWNFGQTYEGNQFP